MSEEDPAVELSKNISNFLDGYQKADIFSALSLLLSFLVHDEGKAKGDLILMLICTRASAMAFSDEEHSETLQ